MNKMIITLTGIYNRGQFCRGLSSIRDWCYENRIPSLYWNNVRGMFKSSITHPGSTSILIREEDYTLLVMRFPDIEPLRSNRNPCIILP